MPKRHRAGASAASVLRHVEEIVLATSGEDAFETVYAVAAARLGVERTLEVSRIADRALFQRVDALLADALHDESTLDAIFESLVPRVAKGDKGQFFTPRHVVDFIVQMLAPRRGEVVVDPACGSGAFLSRARAAGAAARGTDVDARAVRVARLLAVASGAGADTVVRADALSRARAAGGSGSGAGAGAGAGSGSGKKAEKMAMPNAGSAQVVDGAADVVATNPPFAGRADASGFSIADVVRTPERDVLFIERALELLRPGGRLGIVLPYNKASAAAFAGMRRWLVERARILAVVGLPRETFLPHTSQRTFVLFAQKRAKSGGKTGSQPRERTLFAISDRAGKDTGGEPVLDAAGAIDHDLAAVASELAPFLRTEGFGA